MRTRLIILAFWITACGSSAHAQAVKPMTGTAPAAPPATPNAAPAAKQEEEPSPAMAVPPNFKYQSQGRRDPFVNPVPKPVKPAPDVPVVRPPGLKGVLLSEAAVAGVIWSKDPEMNRVVISAPGGRTYFAKKGEALFDAVLKEIQHDGVVFEVKVKDESGNITTRDVTRKVRP